MKIALTLPGGDTIPNPSGLKTPSGGQFTDLASFLSPFLNIIFYIAIFLAFYFLVWGAFQYMMAQGNKEELQKARSRITYALIGLLVVILAYLITTYAAEIFTPGKGGVPF